MNINAAVMAALLTMASATAMADSSQTLELYVDSNTKQIFSEPGANRVKMGTFKSVDASAAGAPNDNAAGIDLVEMKQNLELKQRELEDKLDKIAMGPAPKPASKNWSDTMKVRGYVQIRSNPVIGGDREIAHQGDRSIGENTNFMIRRMRLIFSGDIGERLSYYIQPDFASRTGSADNTGNIAQLRDAYGDIYLTKDRVHRLRVGQSKIPYSFENLQSSQNRIALDRNDALNSCCKDERDLGAFYYWTPVDKQEMFKYLVDSGLKGSGNYGVFAFGAYNGTGANRSENNDNLHLVSRFTYPVKFENGQIFEAGIQAISGTFKPSTSTPTGGDATFPKKDGFKDQRVGVHAVLYPQPFGLQAEWNWGRGPELNDAGTRIEEKSLNGGYVQAMYRIKDFYGHGVMIPFVKWQYFDGAQKFETNAPKNHVNDWEAGFEWQPVPEIEFTAYYSKLDRNNLSTRPYSKYDSDVLRMQLQYNF
ncbi:OprO/OprP family phosphate-selective porin [Methylobacillus gramineus]|uniref:porin n=1 Tax=Methylobacillus gramineus TaxID=755169 RepID=UPI001CFF75B6|nr:porin [Methylobacillus gramineus]MCB5184852.1 OprO/OprP family phosphate-selective porin [Methylobacillus gramineus]